MRDIKTIARIMAELLKKNGERKKVVIVMQGTDVIVIAAQGEERVKEFEVHAIEKAEICDTNGAG